MTSTAVTVQYEVWRNGTMIAVRERTFSSEARMARFFEQAEENGRDLQPIRYSCPSDPWRER